MRESAGETFVPADAQQLAERCNRCENMIASESHEASRGWAERGFMRLRPLVPLSVLSRKSAAILMTLSLLKLTNDVMGSKYSIGLKAGNIPTPYKFS